MTSLLIATSDKTAGGIERALIDQLSLLSQDSSLSISILCPPSRFHAQAAKDYNPIILSSWRRAIFRYAPAFSRIFLSDKKDNYDIALCHNGFLAQGLRQYANEVIGICHNDKPAQFKGCHKLVCLTEDGVQKAIDYGFDKSQIALIPHFHEITQRRAPARPQAPVTIGAAGRFVAKKNLSLFIDIAAIVKQTHPEIRFELGGTGPLKNSLAQHNQNKGLPVTMRGWVDFTTFLDSLDVMVIPSHDEPFGYIFPEAMSQGVGILSTKTFGANHCLNKGQLSALFAPDDAAGFAREICRLADDLDALHALQKACYDYAASPVFAKDQAYQKWQALLHHP